MALAQTLLLTAEDYRLMPETGPRYQLIEGELFMAPAPNRYHQDISGNIEFILMKYLEKHRVGKLYDAPFDVYLGEHNVFQPDKAFVSNERLSILTDMGAEGAPNLVVEILSDSTAHLDKKTKLKVYAANGVEELWLVDPETKSVKLYRFQDSAEEPAAVYHRNESFTSPCFPGLSISLSEIFKR
ncbi:MAG: Uma2 family endonuclease [Verrucomicrobia bacterium]|nr:Uma2 family endonuclease [Verrucomicrobiota bacterium]